MNKLVLLAASAAFLAACGQNESATTVGDAAPEAPPRSGIDLANMDTTVRPGDDFFHYVNGTWIADTAYFDSALDDNQPWETWSEQGEVDMASRANQRWKQILAEYVEPPLDEGVDEALQAYVAEKKASMADAWY